MLDRVFFHTSAQPWWLSLGFMRAQGDKQTTCVVSSRSVCVCVWVVVVRINYSSTAAWFLQTISLIPCSSLTVQRNATHVCFSKAKESHKPTGEPDSLNSLRSEGGVSRFRIGASTLAQCSNERGGDGNERSRSLNVSKEHLNNWTIQTKQHII